MNFIHQDLARGRWFELTLCEQMGNIGSEVGRAANWRRKGNSVDCDKALERALELMDMTITDKRWQKRAKELCRAREVLTDVFYGDNQYNDSPEAMEKYFFQYALAVRLAHKINNTH